MDAPGSSLPDHSDEKSTGANIRVPRYSYYALAVLTLVNFLNYIDRQVLPSVAPFMFKDPKLNLTDTELGYMEAALLLSFTVLAPMFGRLGDRRSRTKLMAGAAVIWSLATALSGLVDRLSFLPASVQLHLPVINVTLAMSGIALALCIVRAVVGVGESSYSTITPSLIADYFPPQKRATALGVFQAAIPMGFALGYVIGAVLASFFGWRMAFMIVGVPGLITAAVVWKLREPMRGATDEHVEAATALEEIAVAPAETSAAQAQEGLEESWIKTSWRILRTRDWLFSTAGYTALTFVLGAFATWATTLLERDKGMTATSAGITLGIVVLLGGATGTFGGGWLADRIAARRHNGYFLVCAVSSFLGIFPTLMALLSNNPYIYLPAIFFAVLLLFVNNAPFHAILINSVPALMRAMAVALNIVVIHLLGDVISRAGVGILSDSLKNGNFRALSGLAQSLGIDPTRFHLTAALLVAPFALVISTFFFLWGSRKNQPLEHG